MLSPKLIEQFFGAASIQRWNDYPRMVEHVELDKQAHKFIIAYFLAKMEAKDSINMVSMIEAGIFEFLRRVVVTDIRPDVFRRALQKKEKEINAWVLEQLRDSLIDIEEGAFYKRFETYLKDPSALSSKLLRIWRLNGSFLSFTKPVNFSIISIGLKKPLMKKSKIIMNS